MALHEYDYEKEATVSIVKNILTDAIKMKASDIHFDPNSNGLTIKFRINGDLIEYTTAPDSVKANITTRIKILSGLNITETSIPQIGTLNFELSSKSHNMRTTSIPVIEGEKIVVHLLNYSKNLKDLKNLGYEKENISKIKEMINNGYGIVLITGANSSGKSTTMYALLNELSKKALNIISVENPIKTKVKGINQVQINNEKGITYKNVLKSILFADPDVIAINELINDETARTALRASITGRLVLSTMHTKNAFTTIKSLLNMEIENYLLGSNLTGIISQRLVKKLCPTCRIKRKASSYEQSILREVLDEEITDIYDPKGCEECQDGYIDQVPIVEVINIDNELRQAISNNRHQDLIYDIIYSENDSIIKDGFKKVKEGITSFEEVIKAIDIKADLSSKDTRFRDMLLGKEVEEPKKEVVKDKEEDPEENPELENVNINPIVVVDDEDNEDNEEVKEEKTTKKKKDDKELNEKQKDSEITDAPKEDVKDKEEKKEVEEPKKDEDDNDESKEVANKEEIESTSEEKNEETSKEEETKEEQEEKKKKTKKDKEDNKLIQDALRMIEEQVKESDNEKDNEESKEEKIENEEQAYNPETETQNESQEVDLEQNKEEQPEEEKAEEQEEAVIEAPPEQENVSEPEQVIETAPSPTPIIIQKDDSEDDDDDDFNYGDSYVNNF